MAKFDKITEGQTLYQVMRRKVRNISIMQGGVVYYPVRVRGINPATRQVLASMHGNAASWYVEAEIAKWSIKEPKI